MWKRLVHLLAYLGVLRLAPLTLSLAGEGLVRVAWWRSRHRHVSATTMRRPQVPLPSWNSALSVRDPSARCGAREGVGTNPC
jgi:hypothetical protein